MRRRHRVGLATAAMAGGVLMAAAGWSLLDRVHPGVDSGALPAASPAADPAVETHAPPVAVAVRGASGFHTEVDPVAATRDGDLTVPARRDRAGWWALGAAPGDSRGTVLIAGHVDTKEGLGAFAELHELDLGTQVEVTGADGRTHRYRITARRTYPHTQLPADLFSSAGPPRLALLTCAGDYDPATGQYADNLVLYGEWTGAGPAHAPSPSSGTAGGERRPREASR
ncbi:class F sortase [Streptomyces sp. NPDC006551]|uniref:class F sortase n=1 Tax=Streptomyces sp. NPDC006551 TaxID=3157178 RepID=UPI0033A323F5